MAVRPNTYANDGGGKTVNGIPVTSSGKAQTTGDAYRDKLRQATVNASQRSANDRGGMNGMFNPGTTHGTNSVGEVVNSRSTTGQGANRVEAWRSANTPSTNDTPVYRGTSDSSDSGGGGGGNYSYSSSSTDDIVDKIKALLEEQKAQADEYYKTQYEQSLSQNKQAWENNRNQINRNYARGDRYLRSMYGDAVSGQGLSNRVRNNANWQSNLATNQQNYTNNDATALANYNMNRANTASQLAQGWYNYVLPVYTNRQQNIDDYDYRRYLATL